MSVVIISTWISDDTPHDLPGEPRLVPPPAETAEEFDARYCGELAIALVTFPPDDGTDVETTWTLNEQKFGAIQRVDGTFDAEAFFAALADEWKPHPPYPN